MSGMPVLRQELDGLLDDALAFLKGDLNAPWAILAETVIGCVPVLGQIVDARDIIKGLTEVTGASRSPLAWFNLVTALIGVVPGGGDAVKRSLRAVKSGAMRPDELLDMIRRHYTGDPEKLLREALDVSKLRKTLDEILANPHLTQRLGGEIRQSIEAIRAHLAKHLDAIDKEVDDWLAKGRKTSADTPPPVKPDAGTPAHKPQTQARDGSGNRKDEHNRVSIDSPNAATQRTRRFKQLASRELGLLGEHLADYHCQQVKGWGRHAAHDESRINPAKLNDGGRMMQLWPIRLRGRGIDAVWKRDGHKPYAIIEAKASHNPARTLNSLLGDAGDKTEAGGRTGGGNIRRRSGSGGQGASGPDSQRQKNGRVMQMSHAWIRARLQSAIGATSPDWPLLRDRRERVYTRHVLFFSIPHAAAHAEALILHAAQRPVEANMHAAHEVTREWTDSDIEKVADKRAGIEGAARDKRNR